MDQPKYDIPFIDQRILVCKEDDSIRCRMDLADHISQEWIYDLSHQLVITHFFSRFHTGTENAAARCKDFKL